MTAKVSVIIPARKEPYLKNTVRDLYANAAGDIEVIVVLDGWQPEKRLKRYKGLRLVQHDKPLGMRQSINDGAEMATGKYLMKIDAHCSIGEGWDEILQDDCADNWIVVPRRYRWDAPTWDFWTDKYQRVDMVDRMEYKYPFFKPYYPRLTTRPNYWKGEQRQDILLDEDMGFQGSCWFMHREHFTDRIGGMDTQNYGSFGEESQEIGLKTQLGPWEGAIMRNKKTWYAHWSKPGEHWKMPADEAGRAPQSERERSYVYAFYHWWHNEWEERSHDFEWLIEKFWPLKGWPENWRYLSRQYNRYKLSDLWLSK